MSSGDAVVASVDELVERVVEVTACTADEAKHYLGACANDVAAAVALFFEQGGSAATAAAAGGGTASTSSSAAIQDDDDVRAPIAPVREQLLLPEDDNFFASGSSSNSSRLSRMTQRVKVCPLRDFAREGALMEEQLQATGLYSDASTHRRRRERSAQMVVAGQALLNSHRSSAASSSSNSTSSRLGDLFRPPTDILYSGSLAAAREFASKRERWLLVNVQSDNFQSQTMNRDVWSSKDLKQLVRRQFVLWQVDDDSSEGRRFVAFYHCAKLPYLCVIDPRTGEEVWRSPEPNQQNVLPDLRQFLRDHRDFSLEEASTSKRAAIQIDDDDDEFEEGAASCSSSTAGTPKKRARLLELTEEEQLELAIKNSMNENGGGGGNSAPTKSGSNSNAAANSDCESLEEFDEDEIKGIAISYETQLGTQLEELTALKLRLLNSSGSDEVVQLRWPSDTKLKTLRLYIRQTHKHIPLEGYKLICAFPRKSLEMEHNESTLKELGLHPSANVHLTLDE
ncbi:LOW QUALITY PROTEIN: UBX domain-containing protein 7 [Drosophila albomicans]|uniref:UBX domain-containing protein 7 n=1 Tax=Drosophila albomicans TaxID=7291 RepID=A0A6P8WMJ5_DROAB|nr:LOW QUALITY PROTEIN: UBX domain-containing protein 7 [Drosophila albomicans]